MKKVTTPAAMRIILIIISCLDIVIAMTLSILK
jgi:hypothetical protein